MKKIVKLELKLTKEGKKFLKNGTPEFQLFQKIPQEGGIERKELQSTCKDLCKFGLKNAMRKRWFKIDKGTIFRNTESPVDEDQ